MAADKLRIGVLGAAKIVPSALLVPAGERSDMVVTHIAARDLAREAEFARTHGLEAAGGYEALISRTDLDLIYIAVPPSGHCEWTIRALEAGKAVLCEKPFALTAEEARRMVEAARETGNPLIEAFHYRFHPTILRAEQLLRDHAIGRIISAHANFCITIPQVPSEFRWIPELGGGAFMDLGCYPLHALRTLLASEAEVVSASGAFAHCVEADGEARLRFASGVEALARCSMQGPDREFDLAIVGERGRLSISNFIVPHAGGVLTLETGGRTRNEEAESRTTYAAQLEHVAQVVLHGAAPMTGGEDAIANMTLIEAVRAAIGESSRS